MPYSLLFIEDNEDILFNLFAWFEEKGFVCDCARNGASGLELASNTQFACIVLDIMLPRLNGIELCKKLRQDGIQTPIIMLTAKDAVEDRVLGLESGADDYLVKPFSLKELEARIHALLRRGNLGNAILKCGNLTLDKSSRMVSVGDAEVRLAPTGFRILETLLAASPAPVRKEDLETLIWGDFPPDGSALRNHIHELRKLLDLPFNTAILETVPRIGWRLKEK